MTADIVLAAAADRLEQMEPCRADYALKSDAGPAVFALLFETARQVYGEPAIQHLQHHLGPILPYGQIQHWRETDRATVVKTLREAAGQPAAPDIEVQALRTKLADLHDQLATAVGWLSITSPSVLAREVGHEMARLRKDNERLRNQLAEERHRHTIGGTK